MSHAVRCGKYAAFDTEEDLVKYVNTWIDPEKIVAFTVAREWISENVVRMRQWHDNDSGHSSPWMHCDLEPCCWFRSDSLPILDDF